MKAREAHDPPVFLDEIASLAIDAWILGTGWRKPYLTLLNCGEQWIFTRDRTTGAASLRGGDVDWATVACRP